MSAFSTPLNTNSPPSTCRHVNGRQSGGNHVRANHDSNREGSVFQSMRTGLKNSSWCHFVAIACRLEMAFALLITQARCFSTS